jgi:hypothetical protein
LVTQGILRLGLSTKKDEVLIFFFWRLIGSNISVDRPAEIAWVLRLEDWRGQVPSRRTITKTGAVPLLLVS